MLYSRTILPRLEKELKLEGNIVLTGMRRVGKTTILKHLFELIASKNKVLLDLENPLYRKIFEEENYDAVWQNLQPFGITNTEKSYIFLDEVQNLPALSSVAKYLSDKWEVKFVLTGSSSYYLKNLFPESLAGRKLIFELFPLTFTEFLEFKNIKRTVPKTFLEKAGQKNKIAYEIYLPLYKEYIAYGGFPSVVLEPDTERKHSLLQEIFTSYFEHDVRQLADFKDMGRLRDLILLLIPRVGQKIEIAKIASILATSRETIYSYLNFLERTYFIKLLPKFSSSIDRQAAGSKKVYLCDGGLVSAIGKLSEGQMFEQSIFQNLHTEHKLAFYSKEGVNEIDFIVDEKTALEAKLHVSVQDIDLLKRRAKSLSTQEKYVVALNYFESKEVILATDL